uniref:Uncharacterized protein n=1 Tax=Glossina austeni TaxID=7395 RepID=A0A1A9VC47_GLOAU
MKNIKEMITASTTTMNSSYGLLLVTGWLLFFILVFKDGDALNRTSVKCVRDAMLFDSRQVASHWSGCWQRSNGRPTTTTTLCTQQTALYINIPITKQAEKLICARISLHKAGMK